VAIEPSAGRVRDHRVGVVRLGRTPVELVDSPAVDLVMKAVLLDPSAAQDRVQLRGRGEARVEDTRADGLDWRAGVADGDQDHRRVAGRSRVGAGQAPNEIHKRWGKEIEPLVVSGTNRWEIFRIVEV
jgi:hypothetical protein